MTGTLTAVVGATGSGRRVDRLHGFATLGLAGIRVAAVRTNVGAVVGVRAARTNGRVVVAVVSGWDVDTDRIQGAVRCVLHRRREDVGRGESNSTRCETRDRHRGQQLESRSAQLRAGARAHMFEHTVSDAGTEGRRAQRAQPAFHR
jgi:hypothetical protein